MNPLTKITWDYETITSTKSGTSLFKKQKDKNKTYELKKSMVIKNNAKQY